MNLFLIIFAQIQFTMTTIVINPKTAEELDFLTKLFQKLNIDARLVNESTPNKETLRAMLDVANRKGKQVKDSTELFEELDI